MLGRFLRVLLISLKVVLSLAAVAPALAAKRVALVIGNSNLQSTSPLTNPLNDAADVAAALKRLGFTVIEGRDLDKLRMDQTIRQFARDLAGADVGVMFYAGHGLQVDGQNFLVPIDAKLEDAAGLEFETVRLDSVHKTMERSTRTNILFLDACRDNPLTRNLARALGTRSATIGRGLATVESGEGTLISFSTQPGNVALDGTGRNSPYAAALVKQLDAPKDDVSALLIGVRNEVMRETRRRQVPWEHSALTAKFYFSPPEPERPAAAPVILPPVPSYAQQAELAYWSSVKDSRDPRVIQSYLDTYPLGTFAALAAILIEKNRAEAAREAEFSKQAGEITRMQEEARAAREALARAQRERPDALKSAEEPRKSQEEVQHRQGAAVPQLAGLSPTLPQATNAETAPTSDYIARGLQQELKRVGCDPGTVDGKWGPRGRSALENFVRRTKVALDVDEPSQAALDALKSQKGRVCPLQCEGDEVERGGQCVPRAERKGATTKATSGASLSNCAWRRKISA